MPPKRQHLKANCSFCDKAIKKGADVEYGEAVKGKSFVAHYFCMLFSSGLRQNGDPDGEELRGFLEADVQHELRRGKRLTCSYCKTRGATVGCSRKSCSKTFHLPCGMSKKCLFQYFGEFGAWCPDHRPCQHIVPLQASPAICLICTDELNPEPSHEVLLMPCCRRSMHRECLQRQAISAGVHFFRCCHCANKLQFQKEMLVCGIYIPEQDASWEREPDAFQDLLYRYKQCDATRCSCPQGRQHSLDNDPEWEVIRCYSCGAKGVHVVCGNLRRDSSGNHQWMCPDCRAVFGPRQLRKRQILATSPATTKLAEESVVPELQSAAIRKGDIAIRKRRHSSDSTYGEDVPQMDGSLDSRRCKIVLTTCHGLPEKKECNDESRCLCRADADATHLWYDREQASRISEEKKQTTGSRHDDKMPCARPQPCVVQGTSSACSSRCGVSADVLRVSQPKRNQNQQTLRTWKLNEHEPTGLNGTNHVIKSSASGAANLHKEKSLNHVTGETRFCQVLQSSATSTPQRTAKCSSMNVQLQNTSPGNLFTESQRDTSVTASLKKVQKKIPRSKGPKASSSSSSSSWVQLSIVNFVRQLAQIGR